MVRDRVQLNSTGKYFDCSGVANEIKTLEAEHTAMMEQWKDLPTPRAKVKAKVVLDALESKIARWNSNKWTTAWKWWNGTSRNSVTSRRPLMWRSSR